MRTNKITQLNFYSREKHEQEWLTSNTWCEFCEKADLGLKNPQEYIESGTLYLKGKCISCDNEIISQIENE